VFLFRHAGSTYRINNVILIGPVLAEVAKPSKPLELSLIGQLLPQQGGFSAPGRTAAATSKTFLPVRRALQPGQIMAALPSTAHSADFALRAVDGHGPRGKQSAASYIFVARALRTRQHHAFSL
jgi:hypothetical protein